MNVGPAAAFGIQLERLQSTLKLSEERVAVLEKDKAELIEAHIDAVNDMAKAYGELQQAKTACSDQVNGLNREHDAEVARLQGRIDGLVAMLQWTRERDKTWRGVHIDVVNAKLEEAIRG